MSLAAGVLSAALALPQAGLVAAYDFARANFVNWSEDLTQSAWVKTGVNVQAMTGLHPEGLPMYAVVETTAANADHRVDQSFPSAPGGLWFAEVDMKRYGRDVVSFGFGTGPAWAAGLPAFSINLTTGQVSNLFPGAQDSSVSARHIGNGVYRVKFAARQGAAPSGTPTIRCWTGTAAPSTGDGMSGVLLTRAKVSFGTDSEYERTTDAQLLLDRSVRLWPAPAARTNWAMWTEDPTATNWINGSSTPTIALNAGTTPRGFPAWTISGGYKALSFQNRAGARITTSCVMKGGSLTTFFVFPKGIGQSITVDASGNVTSNSLVDGAHVVTPLGGGWFEVALTYTPDADRNISTFYVQGGNPVQIGEVRINLASTALPYEKITDGVLPDLSLYGRNLATNSRMLRTSNAALPTGWTVQAPAGATASYSYGTDERGVEYLEVAVTMGASTGAFNLYFTPQGSAGLPYATGQSYSVGLDMTQVSGPFTPLSIAGTHVWGSNGAYVGTPGGGSNQSPAMPTGGVLTRCVTTTPITLPVLAGAAYFTARAGATIALPGDGLTRVYRFARPQVEVGSTLGSFLHSASHATLGSSTGPDVNDPTWTAQGVSFDAADDLIAHRIGLMGPRTFIQVIAPEATTNAFPDWGQIGHTMLYGNAAATAISCNNRRAGGTNAPLNVAVGLTPGRPVFVAVSVQQGRQAAFVNGVRTYVATVSDLQETDLALYYGTNFGKRLVGSEPPKGQQLYAAIYDRALTDAEVAQAYRFIRNQLSIKRGITI